MQDNHSFSKKGVLRGIHFQRNPHPQGKLVRVVSGEVNRLSDDDMDVMNELSMDVGDDFSVELIEEFGSDSLMELVGEFGLEEVVLEHAVVSLFDN